MDREKESGNDITDDFWNLEQLMPQVKKSQLRPSHRDTEAVLVSDKSASAAPLGSKIPKPETVDITEPILTYSPENSLIDSVSVFAWSNRYSFYERFKNDAIRYYAKEGEAAPFVRFFSFMPQYLQLTEAQSRWYFYWRSKLRRGNYPNTDYGYILLYIYEIINLSNLIEPKDGVRYLCELWLAYRGIYPKLDNYLAEWVCDYCLIHRLPAPLEYIGAIIPEIIGLCTLKEFYLRDTEKSPDYALATVLIELSSNYNFRKSKFITEETSKIFEEHIIGAFIYVFEHSPLFSAEKNNLVCIRTKRDAFSGALCACNTKRRLEISYHSYIRTFERRQTVTDIIKFSENQIRSMLGIKSRLSVTALNAELRETVQNYFSQFRKKTAQSDNDSDSVKEYEKLYEPLASEAMPVISMQNAQSIEEKSWEITNILCEAFEDEAESSGDYAPPPAQADAAAQATDGAFPLKTALSHLLIGDKAALLSLAGELNLLPEAMEERINTEAHAIVGDIVIENGELIEDYRKELEAFITE